MFFLLFSFENSDVVSVGLFCPPPKMLNSRRCFFPSSRNGSVCRPKCIKACHERLPTNNETMSTRKTDREREREKAPEDERENAGRVVLAVRVCSLKALRVDSLSRRHHRLFGLSVFRAVCAPRVKDGRTDVNVLTCLISSSLTTAPSNDPN